MRKFLIFIFVSLFLFESDHLVFAVHNFRDVSNDHWAHEYVSSLADDGVLDASKENYRPDEPLNRAELTKLLVELTTGLMENLPPAPNFSDAQPGQWYHPYVETAYALEFVSGYKDSQGNITGFFGPGDLVTRAEASKMVTIALGIPVEDGPDTPFTDVPKNAWFTPYITAAYNWDIVQGYKNANGEYIGKFGPNDTVTRAQIAKMIVKAQEAYAPKYYDDVDS